MSEAEKMGVNIEPEKESRVKVHRDLYTPDHVKKTKMQEKSFTTPSGATKVKYIESRTFENGVVKNQLVGMRKDGKMLWGRDK